MLAMQGNRNAMGTDKNPDRRELILFQKVQAPLSWPIRKSTPSPPGLSAGTCDPQKKGVQCLVPVRHVAGDREARPWAVEGKGKDGERRGLRN